jgi:arylsulfatase A-like enzyme
MPITASPTPLPRLGLALLLGLFASASATSPPRPRFPGANVVLVSIDTLRADRLRLHGGPVATPHLERLAGEGLVFDDAWSPAPMTLPAHATLLTGVDPPVHGVRANAGYRLDAERHRPFTRALAREGYHSVAAVSAYVLRSETGLAAAFDAYDDHLGPRADQPQRAGVATVARALALIDGAPSPFVAFVHLYEPHVPYEPAPRHAARYAHPYDAEIATADDVLGGLLSGLEARGLLERSVLVVTSDHGEGLGDHGEDQHSILVHVEALRVPLVVRLPGGAFGGERVAAPARLADVAPTLLALVSARPSATGTDLLDLRRATRPRFVYGESLYAQLHLGWSALHSLYDGRHHLVAGRRLELFDLRSDPGERHDLSGARPALTAALAARLGALTRPASASLAEQEETRERLAALGYLSTFAAPHGGPAGPDPRDALPSLESFREAMRHAGDGAWELAEAALSRVVAKSPGNLEAWTELGRVRAARGRHEEAIASFDRVLAATNLADVRLARGHSLLALGDATGALADAELAAALPGPAALLRGRALAAQGDVEASERSVRDAASGRHRGEALVVLGELRLARGDLAGAVAAAVEATREPLVPRGAHALLAEARAATGDAAAALAAWHEELAAHPDNLQAQARLAIGLSLLGRRAEAQRTLDALSAAKPRDAARALAQRTRRALALH